jgi:hypothetical protein
MAKDRGNVDPHFPTSAGHAFRQGLLEARKLERHARFELLRMHHNMKRLGASTSKQDAAHAKRGQEAHGMPAL